MGIAADIAERVRTLDTTTRLLTVHAWNSNQGVAFFENGRAFVIMVAPMKIDMGFMTLVANLTNRPPQVLQEVEWNQPDQPWTWSDPPKGAKLVQPMMCVYVDADGSEVPGGREVPQA
jgi:hypothetical protein